MDIEQIGHIYEGLLDHSALELSRGLLIGLRSLSKEAMLRSRVRSWKNYVSRMREADRSAERRKKRIVLPKSWLEFQDEIPAEEFHKVPGACAQDQKRQREFWPFAGFCVRIRLSGGRCSGDLRRPGW